MKKKINSRKEYIPSEKAIFDDSIQSNELFQFSQECSNINELYFDNRVELQPISGQMKAQFNGSLISAESTGLNYGKFNPLPQFVTSNGERPYIPIDKSYCLEHCKGMQGPYENEYILSQDYEADFNQEGNL